MIVKVLKQSVASILWNSMLLCFMSDLQWQCIWMSTACWRWWGGHADGYRQHALWSQSPLYKSGAGRATAPPQPQCSSHTAASDQAAGGRRRDLSVETRCDMWVHWNVDRKITKYSLVLLNHQRSTRSSRQLAPPASSFHHKSATVSWENDIGDINISLLTLCVCLGI